MIGTLALIVAPRPPFVLFASPWIFRFSRKDGVEVFLRCEIVGADLVFVFSNPPYVTLASFFTPLLPPPPLTFCAEPSPTRTFAGRLQPLLSRPFAEVFSFSILFSFFSLQIFPFFFGADHSDPFASEGDSLLFSDPHKSFRSLLSGSD